MEEPAAHQLVFTHSRQNGDEVLRAADTVDVFDVLGQRRFGVAALDFRVDDAAYKRLGELVYKPQTREIFLCLRLLLVQVLHHPFPDAEGKVAQITIAAGVLLTAGKVDIRQHRQRFKGRCHHLGFQQPCIHALPRNQPGIRGAQHKGHIRQHTSFFDGHAVIYVFRLNQRKMQPVRVLGIIIMRHTVLRQPLFQQHLDREQHGQQRIRRFIHKVGQQRKLPLEQETAQADMPVECLPVLMDELVVFDALHQPKQ